MSFDSMRDTVRGAWRSVTIWFNAVLATLLVIVPEAASYAVANLPQLQPYIPENVYKLLMLVALVGNIALRFKTSRPLDQR